jgi:uncharacterized low-complexity protein
MIKNAIITAVVGAIALGVASVGYQIMKTGAEVWASEFIIEQVELKVAATLKQRVGKVEESTAANTKALKYLTKQSKQTNESVQQLLKELKKPK